MRIGELAKAAGVNVETVRFYERKGLIRQPGKPGNGGFRSYDDDVARRIMFIRQGQDLGFSLREIDELLSLRASPDACCSDVRRRAEQKKKEVDGKIVQLNQIRNSLTTLIKACPGKGELDFCSIIGALESAGGEKTKETNNG